MTDPVNLVYYTVVCGGLAAFSPTFENWIVRLIVGLATGGISASLLSVVRGVLGY